LSGVPEETFTLPPSWSSSNLYQLLPPTMIHSILPVQITCLAIFLYNLSPRPLWSSYLLVWSPPHHIPYIFSPNHPVRLITDNIISLLQQNRLRWYGHVSEKNENDWVKNAWIMKCRVHELDVDQRNLGQSRGKRLSDPTTTQGGMLWTVLTGRS